MLGERGLAVPAVGDAAADLPAWLGAALAAPQRKRQVFQVTEGVRIGCASVTLDSGTLIIFAPVPEPGQAPP
jgi:hypothetical protein